MQGLAPSYADIIQSLMTGQAVVQSVSSAGTTDTLTAAQIMGGIYVRSGGTTSTTTTDTATNILAALGPNVYIGQTFLFIYANLNSGTTTLAGGTGVTLQGTTTVLTVNVRFFVGTVTGITTPSVTLQGAFAFGGAIA